MNTPADNLLNDLHKLKELLNKLSERLNESGVTRTCGLRKMMGEDCTYYKKSLNLFIDNDYDDVRNLIEELHEQYLLIERKK